VDREGLVLDGSSLEQCMARIDAACDPAPLGYMVNCSYPSFLHADRLPAAVLSRLLGVQGNASAMDHAQLDGSAATQAEDIAEWGDLMAGLHQKHGIKILGGCCGTGSDHLRYIVQKLNAGPT
ncbi:MAG: homocysteine S-methyltransferase family protein, partial [Desulfosarcinaceae bacterium]